MSREAVMSPAPAPPRSPEGRSDVATTERAMANTGGVAWNPIRRILFRFLFTYLILYIAPFPLDKIPGISRVLRFYYAPLQALVRWTGLHVFHTNVKVAFANGSGDTPYKYIEVFCFAVIA